MGPFSWRCGQKERFLKFWLPVPAARFLKMTLCPDKSLEVKGKKQNKKIITGISTDFDFPPQSVSIIYISEISYLCFFGFCLRLFVVISWGVSGSRNILPQPASEVFPFSLQKEIIR